ncbi:MAG: hypothetical protein ACREYF_16185 [Gammaproteobacteria bacterium]
MFTAKCAPIIVGLILGACAIQRAQVASEAQKKMIGLTREQILACMGPPSAKASEGATEVWSYPSGNNHIAFSNGFATSRFCTVNVTMANGRVASMNYIGPTGGILTPNEQCAFAVEHCPQ